MVKAAPRKFDVLIHNADYALVSTAEDITDTVRYELNPFNI
jgi:hypothetical protein